MPYIHINAEDADGTVLSNEETDLLIRLGQDQGKLRQCSIGFHDECSSPEGDRCACFCHQPRIVCPFCGHSTWVTDHCALPGCEGFREVLQ